MSALSLYDCFAEVSVQMHCSGGKINHNCTGGMPDVAASHPPPAIIHHRTPPPAVPTVQFLCTPPCSRKDVGLARRGARCQLRLKSDSAGRGRACHRHEALSFHRYLAMMLTPDDSSAICP
eukprot:768802-Hanusia_phi.AAC.21